MIFQDSKLAKKYLKDLRGVEIGASSHNPFNLNTINVDSEKCHQNYIKDQIKLTGKSAKVDVFADACRLPFNNKEFDFVISSHVLDRIWRPDIAIKEWCRVATKYIFLIIPHKDRSSNAKIPATRVEEILNRTPTDNYEDKLYNIWDPKSFTDFISSISDYVEPVEVLNSDDKVGNGFCVVLKVKQLYDVLGFWHICMINKYQEIISEQLDLMVSSGLYDRSKNIFVSCVGSDSELQNVNKLLEKYNKIKIQSHRENIEEYEFPALEMIQNASKSNDSFRCFYIHTKGVSWPDHEGGKHWRDYMNYYIIEKWKDNIDRLSSGYDTCGVKLISKGFPLHYSGNFWWANSEYIKKLKPVSDLDKKDRFSAEMWLCSNNPNTSTLCQKFVDYNTKGKFTPDPENKADSKIVVHTLAYNLTSEVETATHLLYDQNKGESFTHVIVDLGFPIIKGDEVPRNIQLAKIENTRQNLNTAIKYNSNFLAIKNKGVSQNWESVRNQMNIKDDEILICADPDERPMTNGWIKAIKDVINNGQKIAWCSLMMKEHLPFLKNHSKTNIAGHDIYLMNTVFNWAQGGFSGKFLNAIGGVPVPKAAPIYGWIEHACCDKMFPIGYKWAILADYYVEHTECSPLYRKWKTHITTHVKAGQVSFEEWLKTTV